MNAATVLCLALVVCPAHALVVLDTFGAGDSADGGNYALQTDPTPGGLTQSLAVPFVLADAAVLNSLLTSIAGTGTYALRIVGDAGGRPLGAALFTATLTNPVKNTLLSGLRVHLDAGRYWLAASAASGSFGAWRGGDVANDAAWAFENPYTNGWALVSPFDAPAVRISAVPEPGSGALMLGGVLLLGAVQARRRTG